MKLRIVLVLVISVLFTTTCNLTLEVGLEKTPATPTGTALPMLAAPTDTPTIPPTEVPTNTPVPTPTPMPGKIVVPITSMGKDIPWLPLDKDRWPSAYIIMINNQLPPFDNSLVRQAFAAAVDRDEIVKMAKQYYVVDPAPAMTFLPPETLGRDLYGEVGINFDPARARDLLAQAGYSDTLAFPKVTFLVNSYGETAPGARFNMATAMAEMWKTTLGVTVEVQVLKPPAFGERLRSDPPALFMVGWTADPGNDPDFMRPIFHTGGEYNYGHFSNAEFDSLVDRAAASRDPAVRQALYIEAERLLCETEAGIIPLFHPFSNKP